MPNVLVLVEGQTEEFFVKRVLAPYLEQRDVWITPTTITNKITRQGDRFKGGVSNYGKIEKDLRLVSQNRSYEVITSMFDLYRIPSDFPGLVNVGARRGRDKAQHLQDAWFQHAAIPHFIPYLQLHEFESLVFAANDIAADVLTGLQDRQLFRRMAEEFTSPEEINDRPDQAPSCRILRACPDYQKRMHGSEITIRAGIEPLLERCPHFAAWVRAISP
jgi:hypothetical protein